MKASGETIKTILLISIIGSQLWANETVPVPVPIVGNYEIICIGKKYGSEVEVELQYVFLSYEKQVSLKVKAANEPEVQTLVKTAPKSGPIKTIIDTGTYEGGGISEFTINAKSTEAEFQNQPKPDPGQKPVGSWEDVTKTMINFSLIRILPIKNNISNVLVEYQTANENYGKFNLINATCEIRTETAK